MRAFLSAVVLVCLGLAASLLPATADTVAQIAATHAAEIEKPFRTTIGPVIGELAGSGDPMAARLLEAWANKTLRLRKSDRALYLLSPDPAG